RELNRAADRAIAQEVIGEHNGHHRLADRHGTDADAGIVAAMRLDLDLMTLAVDRAHRLRDRAGRLDGEAHDNLLPGRDAAENAAGIVREKHGLAVLDADLIAVLFTAEHDRAKPGADLDALDRVDRHHRGSQIAVELAVDRLAEPRRNAARDDLDNRPRRGAGLAPLVEILGPARR